MTLCQILFILSKSLRSSVFLSSVEMGYREPYFLIFSLYQQTLKNSAFSFATLTRALNIDICHNLFLDRWLLSPKAQLWSSHVLSASSPRTRSQTYHWVFPYVPWTRCRDCTIKAPLVILPTLRQQFPTQILVRGKGCPFRRCLCSGSPTELTQSESRFGLKIVVNVLTIHI